MTDPRRAILAAVANGRLSPFEAIERLAPLGADGAGAPRPTELLVRAAHRPVRVLGDEDVRDVVVEGEHVLSRQGDTATVLAGLDAAHGYAIAPAATSTSAHPLLVRVPPDVTCSVEASSATVSVDGVRGRLTLDVTAGTLDVCGIDGPLDLSIRAGAATIAGLLRACIWRVTCLSGSVDVELASGSGARVESEVALGNVSLPSGPLGASSATVGDGAGTLVLRGSVANVRVRTA